MDSGEKRLLELGYKQELRRGLSNFTNFAFSFNVISILTGCTTTFAVGWGYGGPTVIVYGWLVVATFSMFIAMSMAEICSAYPTSGGLYYWAYKLAGEEHGAFWCWITGWFNALGQWAVTASVDFGLAQFIGTLISIGTSGDYYPPRKVTVLIYGGLLISHALVNSLDIRVVGFFENFSVAWHIIGTLVFVIVLPVVAQEKQSADFVFTHFEPYNGGSGIHSDVYKVLVGILFAQYTITGFDASAHMSEETQGADKTAPWGMITAVGVSTVVGFAYLLALLFSIKNPETLMDTSNETGGYVVAQIVYDAFHSRYHNKGSVIAFLMILVVAIWHCGLSCLASNSRMIFAFSRDGAMPLSALWHKVLPKSEVPIYAVWLSATVAFCLGLPYIGSIVAFTAVVSIATIGLFVSYAIPIFLRLTYARNTFKNGPFNLGVFSPICGAISVLWVGFITVLFCLPVIYPIDKENLNYAPVAVGVTLFGSLFAWVVSARKWFKGPVQMVDIKDAKDTTVSV